VEISIVRAQVIRARESVEALLAEESNVKELDQIAEALDALQRAEACIYGLLIERSAGLGQCLPPLANPLTNPLTHPPTNSPESRLECSA